MKKFNHKIGLRDVISSLPIPQSVSNNRYEVADIVESFLLSVWLGCYKSSHTHVLRLDETLKQIFEWDQIPSDTTYKRFFQKFTQGINNEVFPALQGWFFNQLVFDNYALDLDSTAITRYGQQEGNIVGYNPNKLNRPSFHPLFAFLGNERMVVNSWLRQTVKILPSLTVHFLRNKYKHISSSCADVSLTFAAWISFSHRTDPRSLSRA